MTILPSTSLRNKYNEISEKCKQTGEPIYLTKNGEGDIVVMSIEAFERREELYKLKAKLAAAEELRLAGHAGVSLAESRARLEKVYG